LPILHCPCCFLPARVIKNNRDRFYLHPSCCIVIVYILLL
jgi:hypothetical protein